MLKEIDAFLKEARVFYVATEDGGQPRVRPFGAVHLFDGALYLCTNNKKQVFAQLLKNPRLEISAMRADSWIRVSAQAMLDGRREAKKAMLDAYSEVLSRMYSLDDGLFEVFRLSEVAATIYSMTRPPRVLGSQN